MIEELGTKPFDDKLEAFGGWPVVKGDDWDEANWTWTETVQNFYENGYSTDYIFDFSVCTDPINSTKRIIDLDQTTLQLPREYFIKGTNDPLVQAYYRYMVDVAVIFGANQTEAEEEMLESLELELMLANVMFSHLKI